MSLGPAPPNLPPATATTGGTGQGQVTGEVRSLPDMLAGRLAATTRPLTVVAIVAAAEPGLATLRTRFGPIPFAATTPLPVGSTVTLRLAPPALPVSAAALAVRPVPAVVLGVPTPAVAPPVTAAAGPAPPPPAAAPTAPGSVAAAAPLPAGAQPGLPPGLAPPAVAIASLLANQTPAAPAPPIAGAPSPRTRAGDPAAPGRAATADQTGAPAAPRAGGQAQPSAGGPTPQAGARPGTPALPAVAPAPAASVASAASVAPTAPAASVAPVAPVAPAAPAAPAAPIAPAAPAVTVTPIAPTSPAPATPSATAGPPTAPAPAGAGGPAAPPPGGGTAPQAVPTPLPGAALGPAPTPGDGNPMPGLREALSVLSVVEPALAGPVAQTAVVQPTPQMAPTLLFLIAAVQGGDVRHLLGERAIRALEAAGRGALVQRVAGELRAAAWPSVEASGGEWRSLTLPVFHGANWSALTLHVPRPGRDGAGTADDAPAGRRFVIDVTLSRMGPAQLDGLLAGKRLDLALRSHHRFTGAERQDLAARYTAALESSGLTGTLVLTTGKQGWVEIARRRG